MSKGIIFYNKGSKCVVRLIVALRSLRRHYDGAIAVFFEAEEQKITAEEKKLAEDIANTFNVTPIFDFNPSIHHLIRRIEVATKSPFDPTAYLDADILVVGKLDELFDKAVDCDLVIANFAKWVSDGHKIGGRIRCFEGRAPKEYIEDALKHLPAVNGGVWAFPKTSTIFPEWIDLSLKGVGRTPIPDEVAIQILLPRYKCVILPDSFNVSVVYATNTEDKRIIHYHGRKHCKDFPLCRLWIEEFLGACRENLCDIRKYTDRKYGDRRLSAFLHGWTEFKDLWPSVREVFPDAPELTLSTRPVVALPEPIPTTLTISPPVSAGEFPCEFKNEVTVVTACDPKYIEMLKLTFPNWRKYKRIDEMPVVIFVNGMELTDHRLDFLRLPNVRLISWDLPGAENQREKMLSAFILGSSKYVETPWWMKLDADSYATNNRPLFDDSMKNFAFTGHRWGYSWQTHIAALDEWAEKHPDQRLHGNPMFPRGQAQGRRFYHNRKRTISFIQLQSLEFTKLCASLSGERLPVPSHDTLMFYIADKLGLPFRAHNFKRHNGFDQGKSVESLVLRLAQVETQNIK